MRLKGSLAGSLVFAIIGCGGGGSSGPDPYNNNNPPPPPSGNTPPPTGGITVSNNAFSPQSMAVTVGTPVQWGWNTCSGSGGYDSGETCVAHNVTFNDGIFSPTQDTGSFSRTFNVAGTYNYQCTVHGVAMTGSITVN